MTLSCFPDPKIQAQWVFADGFKSCAEAELAGAVVTDHAPTRAAIDAELVKLVAASTKDEATQPTA